MALAGSNARRFLRAARKRLNEAHFLLESEYFTAAVYLAGYAIECGLKGVLLSSEPANRNAATLATFRGAAAHDFDWLVHGLNVRNVTLPREIRRELARLAWWSTDLRYEPAEIRKRTALDFCTSVVNVLGWCERRT